MPTSLNDSVAAEIRAELGRQRISSAELARRLGRSDAWVSYRLSSRHALSTDDLERIADALDVSVHCFLPARVA